MARQRNYALSQQGRSDSLRPLADGVVSVEIDEEEPPHVATVLSLRRAAAWLTSPAGIVLALLVLQSTSVVLLMRYSKTVERPAEAGPPYASTVAIFMSEVFKLPCCLVMAAWSTRHHGGLLPLLRDEMIGKWWTTCKTGVPAFAYTIQGNLLFVALANLEAPTYQVTYQCKTLFTALFSWLLLNRRLQPSQWLALLLLVVGTVLASDTTRAAGGHGRHGGGGHGSGHGSHGGHGSLVVGLGAVLSAALLSASSSVYFEKMLKTPLEGAAALAGLWLRNVQLGCFALPLSAVAMLVSDGAAIREHGLLHGFDGGVVWAVVLLNGVGGLLVAATMKYADNVVKCFATALAIVAGTLLSVPIFGFAPSEHFTAGATVAVAATVLYSAAPTRLPAWCPGRLGAQPATTELAVGQSSGLTPLLAEGQ